MRLREKQSFFVRLVGRLIEYAYLRGFELTFGEASVASPRMVWDLEERRKVYREDAAHMEGSLHYKRLAIDLNLFVDGVWISQGDHPAWTELGEFWEAQDDRCTWGGRFKDANHFSMGHGGKK